MSAFQSHAISWLAPNSQRLRRRDARRQTILPCHIILRWLASIINEGLRVMLTIGIIFSHTIQGYHHSQASQLVQKMCPVGIFVDLQSIGYNLEWTLFAFPGFRGRATWRSMIDPLNSPHMGYCLAGPKSVSVRPDTMTITVQVAITSSSGKTNNDLKPTKYSLSLSWSLSLFLNDDA